MKKRLVLSWKWSSFCALTLLGIAGTAAGTAYAQQAPDAGVLQQQIERERLLPLPEVSKPRAPVMPIVPPSASGLTIQIKRFELIGNSLLSEAQLQRVVSSFLNRPLTFAELQAAAAAVAEAYREAGWVVRTFLPQQALGADAVKIQILEAVFGEVNLQPTDPSLALHVEVERLKKMVFATQQQGKPISTPAIDRALLLLDDLPGVTVEGVLSVGQVDRETDLILRLTNEPWLSGEIRLDNTGARSTGRERLSGNLALASPTRNGDLFDLNLLHTQGSDYARLAYRLPLGFQGWTAGVNASDMRYTLVGDDFSALQAQGSANTAGFDLAYPILRSRQANLAFNLSAEHKQYDNESSGATTTHYRIDAIHFAFQGNRSDDFAGGGHLSGNMTFSAGEVDLSDSPNADADAQTTQTAGRFSKLRYSLNRQQRINHRYALIVSLSGQLAEKNLDSAEKFYLGGASGVRAYPSSEGGGSEGQLLNLELQARLPQNFSLMGFYDWGHVLVDKDHDFAGAAPLNDFSLQGIGLSLAWDGNRGTHAQMTWAYRIGDNPNATADGKDQDGSLVKHRIWLTLNQPF